MKLIVSLFDLKEYEDEEEEEEADDQKQEINSKFEHALEEEDPEVIKELIMLIKKVGGLDELEKQLQMRLNLNENSPVVSKTTTTTTISPISQSLYNKVVGTKRGNLRTQKVINSGGTSSGSEIEPLVQRQNKENRYSSVIRNSRPRPQNDGIDQLSETDGGGIARGEKPQYTTITRTHAPKTQNSDDDEPTAATAATNLDQTDETTASHHSTYQYVNIQRPRVSTTAAPDDADDENADGNSDNDDNEGDDEEEETSKVLPTTTSKMQYVNIQRVRPTKPQYLADEESETPEPETK